MKRIAILVAVLLFVGVGTAAARAQTITVVNHANVRPWVLARVEQAIENQINGPVRRYWHTPKIRFGAGGWKLALSYAYPGPCYSTALGCHSYDSNNQPLMWVTTHGEWWRGLPPTWTITFSHEVVETLVAEQGGPEVCDDINAEYQASNDVMLAGFEEPDKITFDG